MFSSIIKITRVIAHFAKWPLATIILSAALLCHGVQAQSWIDGNTGDWEDGTNWYGGTPGAGDDVFIDDGRATLSSDAGTIESLYIADWNSTNQATLTLDGSDAALAVSLITSLGYIGDATLEVLNGALFSSPYYFGFFAGGPGGGAGNILLGGSVGSRGTLEASRIVREAGSGGGFLTFDGGVLRAASTASGDILSGWSEDVTLNAGGAFIDSNGRNITLDARLVGTGALTKWGAGSLTLSGNNSYSGGTVIEAGTLSVSSDANLGDAAGGLTFIDGTLRATQSFTTGRDIEITSAGAELFFIETAAGATLTLDGSIWGSTSVYNNRFTKRGEGTLVLNSANAHSNTGLNEGTLVLNHSQAAGTGMIWLNSSDAVLRYGDGVDIGNQINGEGFLEVVAGNTATQSGGVTPSNFDGINKTGAGTLILTSNNASALNPFGIEEGTLQVGAGGTTGGLGSGDVDNDASLAFNRSNNLTVTNRISGSGSFTQAGSGTLTLTGTNTYSGGTVIDAGTLQVGAGGTTGGLGSGAVTNNASLVFNRIDDVTLDNSMAGSGSLNQTGNGTLILTNDNASLTGSVAIDAGTLQVGAGGTSGGLGSGDVTNNTTLVFNRSNDFTVNNVITGSGSVMHTGSGTTTLTGINTYSGDTTVSGGTLVVNGSITSAVTVEAGGTLSGSGSVGQVTSAGTLAPGNTPETITVAGDLILDPISVLEFELDTPDVVGGGVNDLIEVNGNLTLDGTLNIIDWGNYGAGTYRLINYTGTLTDNGLDIGTQPTGFNAVLDTSTPGEVNLTVNAISTAAVALPVFNLPGLMFLVLLLAVSGVVRLRK